MADELARSRGGDGHEADAGFRIRGFPRLGGGRSRTGGWASPDPDWWRKTPAGLFARAVLLIRLGRGVDQRDLAIRSGVSTGQLSKIENATYPTWRNAADRIARGLDFPSALLLLYAFYGQDLPATEEALGLEEPEG